MIILRQRSYSWFDKIKNQFHKKTDEEGKANLDKQYQESNKKEEDHPNTIALIPKQYKTLIDIQKKIGKTYPAGFDGDEYPSLSISEDGKVSLGNNESWEEYKWNGKNWEEVNTPFHKTIPNIKSELIKKLEYYKKEYQSNPYGWNEDSLNGVIRHIDTQINEIKRSNL